MTKPKAVFHTSKCVCCNRAFTASHGERTCPDCLEIPPVVTDLSAYRINPPWQLADGTWMRTCRICGKDKVRNLANFRRNMNQTPSVVCIECRNAQTMEAEQKRRAREKTARKTPDKLTRQPRCVFFGEPTGRAISETMPWGRWLRKVRREL